jgi:ubiquitin carboxyl-terminal hydrolase 8
MGPVASNGPPHSRSTSVNIGGPIRTGNGAKPNGIETMNSSHRVLPHIDDLKSARPIVDVNWPLRRIIQDGELFAKQADTHLDFRRPDLALQEYIKASILAVEIIPKHKDYPSLQTERGELHLAYTGLVKRIKAQHAKVDAVIELIKEDNARSGVRPTQTVETNKELPRERVNGHVRAQSVQNPSASGAFRYATNGYQGSELASGTSGKSVHALTSAGVSPARRKPPIQPKPDALHGKSLRTAGSSVSPRSPEEDLVARFTRLRSPVSSRMQDSRIQTRPISIPESPQTPGQSPTASRNSTIRPAGPREMPSAPISAIRPSKMTVGVQIPAMPRPPDAIYSPDRNTDSLAGLNLPSSAGHSSPYLSSKSQTSAPPISTVGPTPSNVDVGTDYFSFEKADSPAYSKSLSKRQDLVIPDTTTVTAEDLVKYVGMGSQALPLLVVDIRSREEFDGGHIMAQSIICVEPIVLRDGMSADELGESIVLSPDVEQMLYEQRHEFDLIVFYDQSSSSLRPDNEAHENMNYLQDFARAIFDYGYSKKTKRRPMLLLGGLDAWVDLMGPGSLKTSSAGMSSAAASARKIPKPTRPLGRVPMARDASKVQALARRPRESRPLSKEEENKWAETLREDTESRMADGESPDADEFSYVRTTEAFFRRYPELPSVQESMISTRPPSMDDHHNELANAAVPRPPTRPAPAIPRQRSSGISERGPSATYAMSSGMGPGTITSTPIPQGLTGLDSTGVTCYVNAVLQCLSATKPLRDFLINYNYPGPRLPPRKSTETSDPPQLLTRNLKNVYGSLWCGQYEWITPKTFWVGAATLPSCTKLAANRYRVM